VIFSLDDNTLATIINIDNENHSCKVRANAKNKLGKFVLTAEYNGIEYTKEISVIPLW